MFLTLNLSLWLATIGRRVSVATFSPVKPTERIKRIAVYTSTIEKHFTVLVFLVANKLVRLCSLIITATVVVLN